ncbi:hypothetical protein [Pseudotamlana agarivorans]|uniref:hypothetical protein n=1 Tax=Pseudotamlana agarivorans TaxID=481183 RepID=UPI000AC5D959|nr:hypothetical protein [Tamlana agarivorans]
MKITKYILQIFLLTCLVMGCTEDENLDYVNDIKAPTNVAAAVSVTQDNTGLVTIAPLGEGVVSFLVDYGDGSEVSDPITPGKTTQHTYSEGSYDAVVTAIGLNGLETKATQNIMVSFKAPENLMVTIENDPAISKQVNVTAMADYALSYEVYFGEDGNDTPVAGNIGETVSYQYQNAGLYTIRIVAMSAAIETLEYIEEFEVTAILQPLDPAPKPTKAATDVISVFSDKYANPDPIDYYPNWGQTTTYAQIQVAGDNIIQYGELTYQGIDFNTVPIDASTMEFIHVDVWSAEDYTINISPISGGPNEAAYPMVLTANQWNSVDIPVSHFTDLNPAVDFSNIIQFKFDGVPSGEGTIFVDNLYFYKESSPVQTGIVGNWKLASVAGALGVGPSVGDISYWNCDADCVVLRDCYYDDIYTFGSDGSFTNDLGAQTWTEAWQGGGDSCGTPIAPHDGSNPATYVYNETDNTVVINGVGAYIGLSKAYNGGELTNPADAPTSIIYNVTFQDPNTMAVNIDVGGGVFWQFILVREGQVNSPLTGTWQMAQEAGALGVGPSVGDISYWNCDADCVTLRDCYYDDTYIFGSDGSFTNDLGTQTWTEAWQGGSDSCGTPVAPHDGSNAATYTYDGSAGTVTLNGIGAFIGLAKPYNGGELASPSEAPEAITYNVSFIDNNTISVSIDIGGGVFWQYKLVRI